MVAVRKIARLDQHRRRVGRLQHHEAGEAVKLRLELHERRHFALEQAAKLDEAFIVSRWARSMRMDETSDASLPRSTPLMMSDLFSRAASRAASRSDATSDSSSEEHKSELQSIMR